MNELQTKLLELMVETDEICRKHDIEYVLFAGTALGAQRHGGFIPWDDDADIIMTLPNYEKFLSVIDGELKEGRAIDCLEKDSDYLLTYGRYVNTETTAIQRHTLFGGCHPGVKLDIFCVVPTFDDAELIEQHKTDILAFSEVVCTTGRMMTYRPEGFYDRYVEELALMKAEGREAYVRNHLQELTHRVEGHTDKCILFSGMASNTKVYDSSIFDEVVYVPFENTELPISAKNVLFSEQHMGRDWMALPANITKPRHQFLLDVNRPYGEYIEAFSKEMSIDEARRACLLKKEHNLIEKDRFRDVLANAQAIRNSDAEIRMEDNLEKLPEDAGWQEKAKAYDPVIRAQLSRDSKVHGLKVKIADEALEDALNALVVLGRFYDADQLIGTCINNGRLTGVEKFVKQTLRATALCRRLTETLYVDGDMAAVRELLNEGSDVPDNVTFVIAECLSGVSGESRVDEAIEKFGNVPELIYLKGLFSDRAGKSDEAENYFREAMKDIRDGFLFQDMINRGIPMEILFDFAEEKEKLRPSVRISAVMKGKGPAKLVKAARGKGCMSVSRRMRFLKHGMWLKNNKRKSEQIFNRYSKVLFGLKINN